MEASFDVFGIKKMKFGILGKIEILAMVDFDVEMLLSARIFIRRPGRISFKIGLSLDAILRIS